MDLLQLGCVIDGRFRIDGCQASGGMGAIFTAFDLSTSRKVALKMMRWASPELSARFAREAAVLARLSHEHIVRYVAHGRTPDGHAYLAMDWLEGELLAQRIRRAPLSVDESLGLAVRVAGALAHAHEQGIIHRDLKPNNLICVAGELERITVVDFGLALVDATMMITRTGEFAGTPGYMAPEQVRGLHDVDARADVYSLGCVLFECLTGRPAFTGEHVYAILAKILVEEELRVSELLPSVPEVVDDLVARMLSRERSRRPRSARELIAELESISASSRMLEPGSHVRGGLGHHERRVFCVILASEEPARHAGADQAAGQPQEQTSLLEETVRSFGGEMERFTRAGDVVVTFRGATSATDLAARAARCALALASLLPRKQLALATVRGVSTRRLLGAAIDEAASLIARAADERDTWVKPGTREPPESAAHGLPVRLDELTAGLLDSHFEVSVSQGGGAALIGYLEHADPARTLLGAPTPFLGRERELGRIAGAYAECVSEPRAQVLVISGPPGIGKSRLRSEVVSRLEESAESPQVWVGVADPTASGASFSLLTSMLRRVADIRPGEDLERRRQKLEARLGQRLSPDEQSRITTFLGEMCGIRAGDGMRPELRAARIDPEAMGDQLYAAWLALLEAESSAGPLLLVLEDLQWGDAASLRFVESALRRLADRPLFVLSTARPEVRGLFPELWSRVPHEHIELGPLSDGTARKLVRRALDAALFAQHGTRIVEHAGGNALYLEELIRAASAHAEEPRTVLAMIAARLEALPAPQRRALRAASILGISFSVGALCPLIGRDACGVVATLDELARDEWLVCQRGATRHEHSEYAFRHGLLRDAAYDMLTDEDRKLGHRLAGEWLSEREGEGHALHVAEHLERGGELGRAAHWYTRAAKRALDGTELRRAIELSQQGLDCAARATEPVNAEALGELRRVLAEAYNWSGANAEAEADGQAALALLTEGEPSWYAAASQLALAAGRLGHVARVLELAEKLLTLSVDEHTVAPWLRAAAPTAERLAFAGRPDLAERLLTRMEERVEAACVVDPTARAQWSVARALHEALRGNPGSSLVHLTVAADVFARFGFQRRGAVQRHVLAYTCVLLGAYERAESELRGLLHEAERLALPRLLAVTRSTLGLVRGHLGAYAEAEALERHALEEACAQGDQSMMARAHQHLCMIHLLAGDAQAAELAAHRALQIEERSLHTVSLALLGRTLLEQRRADEALLVARQAMEALSRAGGVLDREALVRLVWAEALQATGDLDAARGALHEAQARLRARAERISDPDLQAAFLGRVPENARTLMLALACA